MSCLQSSPKFYCLVCAHSNLYMEAKEWWKMGKAGENLSFTTVTTTQVPCCLVDVVKLCDLTVEHLRGEGGISNDTILSQLHLVNSH